MNGVQSISMSLRCPIYYALSQKALHVPVSQSPYTLYGPFVSRVASNTLNSYCVELLFATIDTALYECVLLMKFTAPLHKLKITRGPLISGVWRIIEGDEQWEPSRYVEDSHRGGQGRLAAISLSLCSERAVTSRRYRFGSQWWLGIFLITLCSMFMVKLTTGSHLLMTPSLIITTAWFQRTL